VAALLKAVTIHAATMQAATMQKLQPWKLHLCKLRPYLDMGSVLAVALQVEQSNGVRSALSVIESDANRTAA
jgi:hypothetical protein